ncbi:hypothetical protein HK097_002355 [Rhizophlyctis rosea]|uniref:Uncharacterized protein n=1 Tax=Rhizophlyctis rosea TaxID=64517 RepID=A0AAD5X7W6_9FUNG|nr:hypothetical protein HK097_002355 [Rhizophlyctis rosea]
MFISRSLSAIALVVLAASSDAAPSIKKRAVINHDAVVGFPEIVPSGTTGSVYKAFKPYLEVTNGCVPFPAVDSQGNTSGGLSTSGSPNGGCSSNLGQIYVRSTSVSNRPNGATHALLYSWYFPKDSPSSGLGHRHEWEGVIVFLKSSSSTAASNIVAVCPSAHGDWNCKTSGYSVRNSGPLIRYISVWPINHQMAFTGIAGGQQPLVATALSNTDFGDATVPFKDATFQNNIAKATF